jgi:hypothetical protein
MCRSTKRNGPALDLQRIGLNIGARMPFGDLPIYILSMPWFCPQINALLSGYFAIYYLAGL